MEKLGFLVRLEAKPGKEKDLAELISELKKLADGEKGTLRWYGFQLSGNVFGVFDTFEAEQGREAHLAGPVAKLLMEKAGDMLAVPPTIDKVTLVAVK
jgi:quinol monooxygenase YgiN